MAAYCRGGLLRGVLWPCAGQVRCYAARKGTREKAKKKKVKVEVTKVGFIPHQLRDSVKLKAATQRRIIKDDLKSEPVDDVWVARYHKWRTYSFVEAVLCHKETHHPTVYNVPDAPLTVTFELDLSTDKKTKQVDSLRRLVQIPHPFNPDEARSVIAFCKDAQAQKEALEAGASVVGGSDLIRSIQNGELSLQDFQHVVAHTDIMLELVALKGVMKKKFPNVKSGSLGQDLCSMVSRFRAGIEYVSGKHEANPEYGWIDVVVGKLDMSSEQLEGNFRAVVRDVLAAAPFVTRCSATSPPSVECLKVDLAPYVPSRHISVPSQDET
ncbi:large ribosomal subunit protein uL1m [Bacillus rossius redtenbacheri]|uniref:large ribosomal subunit protein uL1m n=1 Tax=Bacillus rossius redtenbacheri TaxID=93214 RepID=UPI002FDDB176